MLERYYEARQKRMYSLHAHEEALQALENLASETKALAPNQSWQGLIFLISGQPVQPGWSREATAVVSRLRAQDRRLSIEIPLHDVTP